ncbi:iron-containing alcohol dehydrogenase family protein [Natronoarchaeum sp. GCM10025321]|uniref:iron-containing alcohol dehydrogenase family protein n=1 Tax=Natronoarchaeum sp. GCM10025321 TaxID=3252684 RepID=UPI00360F2F15
MSDPVSLSTSRFEYDPGVIRLGRGCVSALADELDRQGCTNALVVCGRTVGSTPAVLDPVTEGLDDRLAGIFAETTPEKLLGTAVDGVERLREVEADTVVSLGGGSSLDTAKVLSVLAATDRSPAEVGDELATSGTIPVPEDGLPAIVAVPTTFAGADLSQGAGVNADPENGLVDEPVSGGVSDPQLMPTAVFADPALFTTTPYDVLAGSAMNGFDKGVETLYARNGTPVSDATAMRGLRLLADALPALDADSSSPETMDRAVEGSLLVQYGVSRPDGSTLSIIHAFGHALRHHAGLQQGTAHAIVAPHALDYLFEQVDGRRTLLARALDVQTAERSSDAVSDGIVDAVTEVRDSLGVTTRLRSVDGIERSDLGAVAETTLADRFMAQVPEGLDPTVEDLRAVLEAAW